MYDSRLNLSKQVVEEVRKYFGEKVYKTFIKRNVKLEKLRFLESQLSSYDATSTGAQNYMELVSEILNNNE